jgi:hypothetical protein
VVAEEEFIASHYVLSVIDSLKKRITAYHLVYIKELKSYIFCHLPEYFPR